VLKFTIKINFIKIVGEGGTSLCLDSGSALSRSRKELQLQRIWDLTVHGRRPKLSDPRLACTDRWGTSLSRWGCPAGHAVGDSWGWSVSLWKGCHQRGRATSPARGVDCHAVWRRFRPHRRSRTAVWVGS
jgi:hypothetical protein